MYNFLRCQFFKHKFLCGDIVIFFYFSLKVSRGSTVAQKKRKKKPTTTTRKKFGHVNIDGVKKSDSNDQSTWTPKIFPSARTQRP